MNVHHFPARRRRLFNGWRKVPGPAARSGEMAGGLRVLAVEERERGVAGGARRLAMRRLVEQLGEAVNRNAIGLHDEPDQRIDEYLRDS